MLKLFEIKVLHSIIFYFYFIYLPHTIKYIINKNAKEYNKDFEVKVQVTKL